MNHCGMPLQILTLPFDSVDFPSKWVKTMRIMELAKSSFFPPLRCLITESFPFTHVNYLLHPSSALSSGSLVSHINTHWRACLFGSCIWTTPLHPDFVSQLPTADMITFLFSPGVLTFSFIFPSSRKYAFFQISFCSSNHNWSVPLMAQLSATLS